MRYKYEKGLLDYTRHSDEKILLARSVGSIIDKNNVKSLLDVGAGEGTFASMIAPQVPHYVAAEKRKENADVLRARGMEVIEQDFPFDIPEKFDMVLASHSIPNDQEGFENFIEHLVRAAKDRGLVSVITYKTDKDPWYELMRDSLQENWHSKNYDTYEMLFDVLKQYGDVSVEKIDTTVRGKTPRELFPALRFIYAGKDAALAQRFNQHRTPVLAWIRDNCKTQDDFVLPFFQYVVTLQKNGDESAEIDPWAKLIHHDQYELIIDGTRITVDDGVFTPDPEITYTTSMIVEHLPPLEGKRVADIGTGSGVLGILASKRGAAEVVATDISDTAIQNAVRNITHNNVEDTVQVEKTDLLEGVDGNFDYIFANIPILGTVWDKEGSTIENTAQRLLESAKSKLNRDGKIYIPWGSFAEGERKHLESLIAQNGYTFGLHTKEALGYRWYLYVISKGKR